jgi:hypothetical protein
MWALTIAASNCSNGRAGTSSGAGGSGRARKPLQHDGGVAPPQLRLERVGEIDDGPEHDLHDPDVGRLEVGA